MKRKVLGCLMVLCLVVGGATGSALAVPQDYFGYDDWGGIWHDANKDWVGDWNLCWAAAASNILDWTGWDAGFSDQDVMFDYFEDHWTDQGGMMEYGWDWWFDGTNPSQGWPGWSQVDVPGGGFYDPPYSFSDYFHESWNGNTMAAIDQYLHDGYGVALAIYDGGHAITAWGFEYDPENPDYYTGIYVTDSDDTTTQLAYYPVTWNSGTNLWDLGDGFTGWAIEGVQALDRNPEAVPEPATILLLGSGLIGLAVFGRKKFKRS